MIGIVERTPLSHCSRYLPSEMSAFISAHFLQLEGGFNGAYSTYSKWAEGIISGYFISTKLSRAKSGSRHSVIKFLVAAPFSRLFEMSQVPTRIQFVIPECLIPDKSTRGRIQNAENQSLMDSRFRGNDGPLRTLP